ncbi:MAG: DNA internalization-related competence protein ComEC/Rec2 [Nitrospinota bacterium]
MTTPLFYLFIFYTEGIVLGRLPLPPILSFFIILFSVSLFFLILSKNSENKNVSRYIIVTLSIVSIFGYTHISYLKPYRPPNHISYLAANKSVSLYGRLTKPPEIYGNGERLYIESRLLVIDGREIETKGTVRVSIYGESSAVRYGDLVRIDKLRLREPVNYKNRGGFDYKGFLRDRDIYLIASIRNRSQIAILKNLESPNIYALIYSLKSRFLSFLDSSLPPPEKEIMETMVFGEKGAIGVAEREKFSKAGISHILAVSGLHVGFVSLIFYFLFYRLFFFLFLKRNRRYLLLGYSGRFASAATIIPVVGYTIMTGGSPSSFRAAVMIVIYLFFISLGREGDILSSIILAAMIILMRNPAQLFDVGFQLSFMALLSIVYGYPLVAGGKLLNPIRESNIWGKIWGGVLKGFIISLLAIAGTAPIVAYYFNIFSPVAPITNIAAVPLTALIVPTTLFASAISLISYKAASLLILIPQNLSLLLRYIVDISLRLPFAYLRLAPPSIGVIIVYYIFLFTLFQVRRGSAYKIVAASSFGLLSAILILNPIIRERGERGVISASFLDVGEGASIFIRSPSGKNILIDGGKSFGDFNIGRLVVAPYLWRKGVKRIDYLIATHPDRDHVGGLTYIAEELEIGTYIDNGLKSRDKTISLLRKIVASKGIAYHIAKQGDRLQVDEETTISFLNPPELLGSNDNDSSIVSKIAYKDFSILSTGDIGTDAEGEIDLMSAKATIMEVPHHGSGTSSSTKLIEAVSPEVAIISAGINNHYGHPKGEVVERYKGFGTMVYVTAIDGGIEISSDGHGYNIRGYTDASSPF